MTRPECPKCHAPMPWSGRQQCKACLWRSDPITASELATSRAAVVKKQLDGAMRDITRRIDEKVYAPKQVERMPAGTHGEIVYWDGAKP